MTPTETDAHVAAIKAGIIAFLKANPGVDFSPVGLPLQAGLEYLAANNATSVQPQDGGGGSGCCGNQN